LVKYETKIKKIYFREMNMQKKEVSNYLFSVNNEMMINE